MKTIEEQIADWQIAYQICADEDNTFVEIMDYIDSKILELQGE